MSLSLKCHKLVLLLSVVVRGLEVQLKGEVSLSLNGSEEMWWRARVEREGRRPPARDVIGVTAPAPPDPDSDCVYQYPEKKQLNALLSNMMNELTKIFTRVHQLVSRENAVKRFKVIKQKNIRFFEDVFKNMTIKFRRLYTREMLRIPPPADTCASQDSLKKMWNDLLEASVGSLRHAALLTTAEYLRVQHRSTDRRVRRRLGRFLDGEIARARSNHLALLCDTYQLCYGELV